MTTGLATDLADAILDDVCGTVWVKLHTGDPGAAGTAHAATETTRQQATFASASGGVANTSGDMVWTSVAGTETYSHISLWNDATAGSFMGSDALDVARAVTTGDNFTIAAGDASLSLVPLAA